MNYKNQQEIAYLGYWIELTEQQDEGLFLAGIRITDRAPSVKSRKWSNIAPDKIVCFDFEDACEEALQQAKDYIDALMAAEIATA